MTSCAVSPRKVVFEDMEITVSVQCISKKSLFTNIRRQKQHAALHVMEAGTVSWSFHEEFLWPVLTYSVAHSVLHLYENLHYLQTIWVCRNVAVSSNVIENDYKMSCSWLYNTLPKGFSDFLILWLSYFTDNIHLSAYPYVCLWFRFCLTLALH